MKLIAPIEKDEDIVNKKYVDDKTKILSIDQFSDNGGWVYPIISDKEKDNRYIHKGLAYNISSPSINYLAIGNSLSGNEHRKGIFRIYGNNTNYVQFGSPNDLTQPVTLTLPKINGTLGLNTLNYNGIWTTTEDPKYVEFPYPADGNKNRVIILTMITIEGNSYMGYISLDVPQINTSGNIMSFNNNVVTYSFDENQKIRIGCETIPGRVSLLWYNI
jgi:hypothetical protein